MDSSSSAKPTRATAYLNWWWIDFHQIDATDTPPWHISPNATNETIGALFYLSVENVQRAYAVCRNGGSREADRPSILKQDGEPHVSVWERRGPYRQFVTGRHRYSAILFRAVTGVSLKDGAVRPPSLLALPSFLAGNVARIGHRLLLHVLAKHELRLPHAAILAALSDFGPLAQYELADRLDIQRSHLVGYVDLLEDRGLVRRERDPGDRRRQTVALTKAGRALWRRLHPAAERSQAQLLDVLSDSEREALLALLARVLTAHDEARLQAVADLPA